MNPNEIELRVEQHADGLYTLTEKRGRSARNAVVSDNLAGNADGHSFYRSAARHIAKRVTEGFAVTYKDVADGA